MQRTWTDRRCPLCLGTMSCRGLTVQYFVRSCVPNMSRRSTTVYIVPTGSGRRIAERVRSHYSLGDASSVEELGIGKPGTKFVYSEFVVKLGSSSADYVTDIYCYPAAVRPADAGPGCYGRHDRIPGKRTQGQLRSPLPPWPRQSHNSRRLW